MKTTNCLIAIVWIAAIGLHFAGSEFDEARIKMIKRTSTTLMAMAAAIGLAIAGCDESNVSSQSNESNVNRLSYEDAVAELKTLKNSITWSTQEGDRMEPVALVPGREMDKVLPDIDQYLLTADPPVNDGDVVVEIFVTTKRAWSPAIEGRKRTADGFMAEVAQAFNDEGHTLGDGRRAKVRIRSIASGTGFQYISSETYVPDAFSPVNHLWLKMLEAKGYLLTPIRDHMATSISGVVIKKNKAEELRSTYGTLDVKAVINEVVQGKITIGYTNPFHSSTGLNFLLTTLSTFGDGHEDKMLSPAVIDTFVQFQRSVPFVALTTVEMRESVLKGGSLDAFVMGYQSFVSTEQMQAGYEFVPYGIKNKYPLYAVGNLSPEKREVLELLAMTAERPEFKKLATDYGWNEKYATDYQPTIGLPSGDVLLKAQKLWKQKKDAGRPIAAVFLTDISGSMAGSRLSGVRKALIKGSEFIGPENSIGLVLFDDDVRVVQAIKKFDLKHRARFVASAMGMQPSGGTAMYNGIVVALSLLIEEKYKNPDIKPMLFVLTDGETNSGFEFDRLSPVIAGLKIPVNTIGYEADLAELKRVARLVEATTMNAGEGNVVYKIATLLDAKM